MPDHPDRGCPCPEHGDLCGRLNWTGHCQWRAGRAQAEEARRDQILRDTRELHIVLDYLDPGPQATFVELEDQDGKSVGGFEHRKAANGLTHIVIPLDHDSTEGARQMAAELSDVTESADRLLEQREQARVGESRLAEERDCAFALLRWLLPVAVIKRID